MDEKTTCMACSCPCEAHKEHNHPVEKKEAAAHEHAEGGTCSSCAVK
jgi:hypothetical protein